MIFIIVLHCIIITYQYLTLFLIYNSISHNKDEHRGIFKITFILFFDFQLTKYYYMVFYNKNDGVTGFGMDLLISSIYTKLFINYNFNNVYPANNLVVKANNMLLYILLLQTIKKCIFKNYYH